MRIPASEDCSRVVGEPLVCDPRDAIRSLYCSEIDALVIGNFLIAKQ